MGQLSVVRVLVYDITPGGNDVVVVIDLVWRFSWEPYHNTYRKYGNTINQYRCRAAVSRGTVLLQNTVRVRNANGKQPKISLSLYIKSDTDFCNKWEIDQ
jgi:hypothetical protein